MSSTSRLGFCCMHFNQPTTIAALLGQAVGDAWGAPLERHKNAPELGRRSLSEGRYLTHEDVEAKSHRARLPGLYTDDTQQALALLRARRIRPTPAGAAEFFHDDLRGMFLCRVGGSKAGVHRGTGGNFRTAVVSGSPVDSAGIGAAMRVGPVATTFDSLEDLTPYIIETAKVTTSNILSITGAVWFATVCWDLSHTAQRRTYEPQTHPELREAWPLFDEAHNELIEGGSEALLAYATATGLSNKELTEPANGFVLTTVPWAAHHALIADTFEESLLGVTTSRGDVDTVAAMAGCLSAIRHGREVIPEWMLDGLVGRAALEDPSSWQPLGTEAPLTSAEMALQRKLMGAR